MPTISGAMTIHTAGATVEQEQAMITLEDCIAFCGLTEAEVMAIAEHEHVPEIAAAAMAECLLKQRRGVDKIHCMIVDDMRAALRRGDKKHASELFAALRHFLSTHPEHMH